MDPATIKLSSTWTTQPKPRRYIPSSFMVLILMCAGSHDSPFAIDINAFSTQSAMQSLYSLHGKLALCFSTSRVAHGIGSAERDTSFETDVSLSKHSSWAPFQNCGGNRLIMARSLFLDSNACQGVDVIVMRCQTAVQRADRVLCLSPSRSGRGEALAAWRAKMLMRTRTVRKMLKYIAGVGMCAEKLYVGDLHQLREEK